MRILNVCIVGLMLSTSAVANPVYLSPIEESVEDARLRFVLKFGGEQAQELSQATFEQQIQQHIKEIFAKKKSLTQPEFVTRHNAKSSVELAKFREMQIKQTQVRFKSIDANKDERIDLHEFQAVGLKSFARYDSNKDGYMDSKDSKETIEAEAQQKDNASLKYRLKPLLAMPTTHNAQGFMALYTENGQKRVSLADYLKMREQQFSRTDSNQDGLIDSMEYETEFLQRADEMMEKTKQKLSDFTAQRFKAIDTDHNGKISPQDVVLFSKHYFAFWDTDNNGMVTLTETLPKIAQ